MIQILFASFDGRGEELQFILLYWIMELIHPKTKPATTHFVFTAIIKNSKMNEV